MCHLSYAKGRNTYYNAVLLQVCIFTKQIENVQSISLLKKTHRNVHGVLLHEIFFVNFDFEVVMDGNINQKQIYANFVTI